MASQLKERDMKGTCTIDDSQVSHHQEPNDFEEMVEATQRRAYSMALQLTRNASDAEDLLQETKMKAWRGFDSYMSGKPFLNWFLRIMQRAYLDTKRRENPVRKAESLNSMISPSDGEVQELPIPDESPNPEEELFHHEWVKELRGALDQLPEVYRSAISMCDLEQMSYGEIADAQGTTIGTVRSRIHRGRKLLREIILAKGIQIPQ
jgi:RNA polymerase sigma-70 factor, ECF subfamily